MGRILAIGDIHGCSRAFDAVLEYADLRPDDTIVTLGDYVDRGPDTKGVVDRLIALGETHHLVSLRGNHELMLFDAVEEAYAHTDWLRNGGDATLASYGSLDAIPDSHWRFLGEGCLDYWETETQVSE